MTKHKKAFTLLELLVVIAILAILLTISFTALNRFRSSTEIQQAKQVIARELARARSDAYRLGIDQKVSWTENELIIEGDSKRSIVFSDSNRVQIKEAGDFTYTAPYGTKFGNREALELVLKGNSQVQATILVIGIRGKVYTN